MAERVHPLAPLAAESSACPAATLSAQPPMTRLLIRSKADLAAMGLRPPDVCRACTSGDRTVLWLGPDEFLLLTSVEPAPAGASVVDVSHRDTALTVSGPSAAWVVNAFCTLDLHETAFPVGMCTRTLFGRATILLWRIAPDTFRIDVARSFAPYVWACLEEARREFLP